MERLILILHLGDACTWSAEETIPVLYESKEKLLRDLDEFVLRLMEEEKKQYDSNRAYSEALQKQIHEARAAGFHGEMTEKKREKSEAFWEKLKKKYPLPERYDAKPIKFLGRTWMTPDLFDSDTSDGKTPGPRYEVMTLEEFYARAISGGMTE